MTTIRKISKTRTICNKIFQRSLNFKHEGKVVYAGIQPTGVPHVGNWFGSIRPWLKCQDQQDSLCIFSINDRHALNLGLPHTLIRENVYRTAACLLAAGLDPERSILVLQSQVPNMLRWILWSMTYREDTDKPFVKMKNLMNGLRSYSVFEAANILLYRSTHVVIGSSNVPLVEKCQALAELFNQQYGSVFPVPSPHVELGAASNVLSLRNPEKKMSKTDLNERSRVCLLDSEEDILAKFMKAVTDCTSQVTFDPVHRPGVSNLIALHGLATGRSVEELCQQAASQDTGQYKVSVAKALAHHLKPLRTKAQHLLSEPHKLDGILHAGSARAAQLAAQTLRLAQQARGLSCSGQATSFHSSHKSSASLAPEAGRVIFSGIQPTGGLPHLGNLFGAVDLWLQLQDQPQARCIFSIVDLHAITTQPHAPQQLRKNVFMMAASLLAFGLDPDKCILFLQSQVPQHEELFSLLWPFTTEARVSRLPQYKEKVAGMRKIPNGLHAYPVLQAADILLYRATEVPIGEDQVQHLQLCQDICLNFNKMCGQDILPVPQIVLSQLPRLKSLLDPSKKMSKSDPDPQSRIELTDTPDQIQRKILHSQTCGNHGLENLMAIHRLAARTSQADVEAQAARLDLTLYKKIVAEAIVERLKPCQKHFQELLADPLLIEQTLAAGAKKAAALAQDTLDTLHRTLHEYKSC